MITTDENPQEPVTIGLDKYYGRNFRGGKALHVCEGGQFENCTFTCETLTFKIKPLTHAVHLINSTFTGDVKLDVTSKIAMVKFIERHGPEVLDHVTELIIESKNMRKLPLEIFELKNLRKLSFKNAFMHIMPKEIGQLSQLEALTMINCKRLEWLPSEIGKLTKLEYLEIAGDCSMLIALPNEISQLKNLTTLILNDLSGIKTLSDDIVRGLSALTDLRFINCMSLMWLPISVGHLTNLKNVEVSACPNLGFLNRDWGKLEQISKIAIKDCPNLTTISKALMPLYENDKITGLSDKIQWVDAI